MPECSYCGEGFDDEDALLAHLRDEHDGELGAIDRRRVAALDGEGGWELPTGPAILAGVILISLAVVVYVTVFLGGGGGGDEPGPFGSAHVHGTMEMTVLGEPVDFSQPRYQVEADRFHFESGNGEVWHAHATGVTLAWAMDTLDIGVTEDAVSFRGTTYRDGDPNTEVIVEVDGEPVDPETYVLEGVADGSGQGGDHVRIVVRRTDANATATG